MKIKEIINNKLNDMRLNHSNGTYRFYKSHTNHFLNWLITQSITYVDELDDNIFLSYIEYQKETASNTTINKRIGILKRCFAYSNINFKLLDGYKKLKERYVTFEALDAKTYIKIRKYTFNMITLNNNQVMHKCMLALLCDTGARIDELLNIEIKNIDLRLRTILLTKTKTDIDRVIFYTAQSDEIISDMICINYKSKYLLYNFDKDRPAVYEDARYLIRKIKDIFNLKKLSTHMFRHTLATYMIENGADLFSLMKILGHQNIKTTQRYTHLSSAYINKTYQNTMNRLLL